MSAESKFFIGVGFVTLMLVIAGVFFLGSQKPKENNPKIDQGSILSEAKHTIGDSGAPVSVVEFGDFQCPACAAAAPIVKTIIEKNRDKVYFVFRHYPLANHKNARDAARAAEAAGSQGKFFEMHDMLYERQKEWAESDKPKEIFEKYASDIGLDLDKFKNDFGVGAENINADFALGNKSGVNSTPTFFINGQKYPGVISQDQFQGIINQTSASNLQSKLVDTPFDNFCYSFG